MANEDFSSKVTNGGTGTLRTLTFRRPEMLDGEFSAEFLLAIYEGGTLVASIDQEGRFTCVDRHRLVKALRSTADQLRVLQEAITRLLPTT